MIPIEIPGWVYSYSNQIAVFTTALRAGIGDFMSVPAQHYSQARQFQVNQ